MPITFNKASFGHKLTDKLDLIYDRKGTYMAQFGGSLLIACVIIAIFSYFVYGKETDAVIGILGFFLIECCVLIIASIPFIGLLFVILNKVFWMSELLAILELEASVLTSTMEIGFLIVGVILFVLFTMLTIYAMVLKKAIEFGLITIINQAINKRRESKKIN